MTPLRLRRRVGAVLGEVAYQAGRVAFLVLVLGPDIVADIKRREIDSDAVSPHRGISASGTPHGREERRLSPRRDPFLTRSP